MADVPGPWRRQGETFWRAHHESWKRSDLNQREFFESRSIPLKACGNLAGEVQSGAPAPGAQAALPARRKSQAKSHP